MIKVNLLKTKVSGGVADMTSTATIGTASVSVGAENLSPVEVILKIALMIVFAYGLSYYEADNIETLQAQLKKEKSATSETQKQLTELRAQAGRAEQVKGQIDQLQEKLDILTGLSRKRLRELKALDSLQNFLPNGVWFRTLKYNGRGFDLNGSSATNEDLDEFEAALNASPVYTNVIRLSSVSSQTTQGTIINFQLQFDLGDVQ